LVIDTDSGRPDGAGLDTSRTSGAKEEERNVVIIKWRDVLADDSWTRAKDVECPVLFSVGWLAYEDDETIKIASTLDYDDFTGEAKGEALPIPYGVTAFPRGCVVEVKRIKDCKHIEF
jgi:hypothetical protein